MKSREEIMKIMQSVGGTADVNPAIIELLLNIRSLLMKIVQSEYGDSSIDNM